MRIAVLGGKGEWTANQLRRVAGSRHEIVTLGYEQLAVTVTGSQIKPHLGMVDLRSYGALLTRTMPRGSLEQIIFRMDALGQLAAEGTAIVNAPRAMETAIDKFLATARLAAAGLRVPRTIVCQTLDDCLRAFEELGGDVVAKPLFGGEGRGLMRIREQDLLWRAAKLLVDAGSVIYLQEFIPHEGFDVRVLLVGDEFFAVRRNNQSDWRTNVSRGGQAEPIEPPADLLDIARIAATTVGAVFAGVDLLPGRDGHHYVLEVNAAPGWRATAQAVGRDISASVLALLERSAVRPSDS